MTIGPAAPPQIIDCPQGTDAWHAARAGIATASRFADVIAEGRKKGAEAVSRRNLRIELVLERITGQRIAGYESFAMRQGTAREAAARLAYEVATGDVVRQVGFVRHGLLEAGASPDGLIGDEGGLEIKAPEPAAHHEALLRRRVPAGYIPQVQGGLWICERRWWRFVSYNPDFPAGRRLVIIHCPRDETYIAGLALAVALFMEEVRDTAAELLNTEGDG